MKNVCWNKNKIELKLKAKPQTTILLEDTNLVSNVHSFAVVGKTNESLLEAKRSNDSVNLSTLYIIEFANSMADLSLVSTEINEERENTFSLQLNELYSKYLLQSSS